jgi:hypothetical protein
MTETWTCGKCRMGFEIKPAQGEGSGNGRFCAPQRLRCPECRLPFYTGTSNTRTLATVGMEHRPTC